MLKSVFISFFTAALMGLACTATAAVANSTDKKPIRIGMIDPLSGAMAIAARPTFETLKFDAARINKHGGINGHKIEIVGLDNKISPKQSLAQLHKAIDEGIHYITQGVSSSVGSALLNAIDKHNRRNPDDRVLYLNWAAVDPAFTNERCSFWHFRFDSNEDMKINTLTDWIAQQKNIRKVFLFNQDYSFGHNLAKSARKLLKKKDPDIDIVGNTFVPLGKVKDFTPYVSKIKASGADAVITGNYGQDMTLLVKAAADYGLDIPFLTYYGNTPGTVKALGEKGVGRLYLINEVPGDYNNPKMAKREKKFSKETKWDYGNLRVTDMLEMLKLAAEKADSIDPTKVAFALEGLHFDSLMGPVIMRAKDHQILAPIFISVLQDHMKIGIDGTKDISFHKLAKFSAKQVALPTSCHMRRPKQ
jgi:branched-chain amino acid transport system substrate-binding protein